MDVRPREEYKQGHIPGVIPIPLGELKERLPDLGCDKPVVAYCRGRFCILADTAVEILTLNGFDASRADDGILEWDQAGYPIPDRNRRRIAGLASSIRRQHPA